MWYILGTTEYRSIVDKGKPAVTRGRKAYGPWIDKAAGLPKRSGCFLSIHTSFAFQAFIAAPESDFFSGRLIGGKGPGSGGGAALQLIHPRPAKRLHPSPNWVPDSLNWRRIMIKYLVVSFLSLWILFLAVGGCSGAGGGVTGVDISSSGADITGGSSSSLSKSGDALDLSPIIVKAAANPIKIKRDADTSSFTDSVNIRAARNEHEAFQVIPMPGHDNLDDVVVGVSDLTGPGGAIFSHANFSYFLEGYVYCQSSSDFSGDTGWFPDPLVPISDPFDVKSSVGLQPVWVDCFVPGGTTPGIYNGNVNVTAAGGLMKSIPIRLKVLDMTLDNSRQLKTAFGLNRECINAAHGFAVGEFNPTVDAVWTKYTDMLVSKGLSFWGIDWFKPSYKVNTDNTVTVNFSVINAKFSRYLAGSNALSAFHFPLRPWDLTTGAMASNVKVGDSTWRKRVKSYIQECAKYFNTKGILDKTYLYVIDEPNTGTDYSNVRYLGQLIDECNPKPRFLVTEQPYSWNYKQWGSLLGYVDIFCPLINLVRGYEHVDPADPYNLGTYVYDSWVYTNTNVAPYPGFAIDHPALEPRLMPWLCYQQNIEGMLYFSVDYWKMANPWQDPYTWGDPAYGAGNGCLMYPGQYINQYTGQDNIDGPISTIRLEEIREGLEDYEYLMAIAGGEKIPELDLIISDYDQYTTDGAFFYKLRNIGIDYFFAGK